MSSNKETPPPDRIWINHPRSLSMRTIYSDEDRRGDPLLGDVQYARVHADEPAWSSDPPTTQGWYWHWDGNKLSAPFPLSVLRHGAGERKCFVSLGQAGLTRAIDCDEYGGLWMPLLFPCATRSPPAISGAELGEIEKRIEPSVTLLRNSDLSIKHKRFITSLISADIPKLISAIRASSPVVDAVGDERKPHREICSICSEVSRVMFSVPNEVWELAVHRSQLNDIICLRCFTRLADERGVEWDKEITFQPVSRMSLDRTDDKPHPEDSCMRCHGPNISWFAPNELWNKHVRDNNEPGILCPVCFVQLAERGGVSTTWSVTPFQSAVYKGEVARRAAKKILADVFESRSEFSTLKGSIRNMLKEEITSIIEDELRGKP